MEVLHPVPMGVPQPVPMGGCTSIWLTRGTPSSPDGEYPIQPNGGVPHPVPTRGYSQLANGRYPGVTPLWDWLGVSPTHQDRMGVPPFGLNGDTLHPLGLDAGTPIGLDGSTNPPLPPPSRLDGVPPPSPPLGDRETEPLPGGRYASCVHAGRLSFFKKKYRICK